MPIKEEEEEEPKKDTSELGHRCMQKVCRAFYAFRTLSLNVSPAPRLVCKAFCTFRALSPCMSLMTACMSYAFCTVAEPDDADAWDADNNASDVAMYTQFSEGEMEGETEGWGEEEGWPDPDEARGRQLSQPLFFNAHTHTAPAPLQPRSHSRPHSGGGADMMLPEILLLYTVF